MANEKLLKWLFETKAIRVCKEDKPFWYTSGTIGPYYINTHFLYGTEEKANSLLKTIDVEKENILTCPIKILNETVTNYNNDVVYNGLIDEMTAFIRNNIDLNSVDYISGGERRDWFFSLIIANILSKPHITIYKDMKTVISNNKIVSSTQSINGGKVLHIADLITEASSYERAWIPAIKNIGGEIKWSVVVVDRKQGGDILLKSNSIIPLSMVNIEKSLFEKAVEIGLINNEQFSMLEKYISNPKEAMRGFLLENPGFLENALKADDKTVERAKLCVDKNIYDLK